MTTPAGGGEGATPSGAGESSTEPQVPGTVETPESGSEGETPVSKADLAREVDKWKALSRRNEQRAKENAAAAKKLQEFEDSNKTELQKAQDAAAAAHSEAVNARAERHRLLAAATHGLGPDFVDYLGGGEETEIFERAETLAKNIQSQVEAQVTAELAKYGIQSGQPGTAPTAAGAASLALGRRPVESLRPGSAPASNGAPASSNDLFRGMLGR